VGGSSSITVTVKDAGGNRISGAAVTATSTGTGNSFSPASAVTDDNGVATFSFSSTVAERKTITVTAGGVTLHDTPVITVILHSSTTQITGITPEPSTAGGSVHVTWSVTGDGGTPTGTVTVSSSLEATGDQCTNVPVSQGACDVTLNTAGTHQISASYSGDAQFEDSGDQKMHTVAPVTPPADQPPVASFTHDLCVPDTPCQFTSTSTDPDAGDAVTEWSWSFSDGGATSDPTIANPTHTFAAGGPYNVTLTVKDISGTSSAPDVESITVP
jgi:hypothetical protein